MRDFAKAVVIARSIGREHGRLAAAQWQRDALGLATTSYIVARDTLAAIEDGDSEVLDTLPSPDLSGQWAGAYSMADLYLACDWPIDQDDTGEIATVYEDRFTIACLAAIEAYCRDDLANTPR